MSDHSEVSVVIPAYNQANFLGEAIQSVLDQTFKNFELIIVNDASHDNTAEVVGQFSDPRIRFLAHNINRGLPASRNTGLRASSGELIALLDADDIYHPEKLQTHVEFLAKHPEVGVSYNNRFELNYSSTTIRDLWRPPRFVSLSDLVLGFPFAPSDIVMRREWVFRVGLFDENFHFYGEDLTMNCQLALSGCKFANVDRALNYRRHQSGRRIRDISGAIQSVFQSLRNTLNDPRCPVEVKALGNVAFANSYLVWAYEAFVQNETDLGQSFLREAVHLKPSVLEGSPCELIQFLVYRSIADESKNHETILENLLAQLPPEMAWLSNQYDWAVRHGYLVRGARAIMWDRINDGHRHFARAAELTAEIDEIFLQELTHQLLGYEREFGNEDAGNVICELATYLQKVGGPSHTRELRGYYMVNKAFQNYQTGNFKSVPRDVLRAVTDRPEFILNKGVVSIFFHSLTKRY
jgi:glycosyltransferase involved in cell wall biosynthesis